METKAREIRVESLKTQFPLKFLPKDKNYVLCEGGLIYIYRPECKNHAESSKPSTLAPRL